RDPTAAHLTRLAVERLVGDLPSMHIQRHYDPHRDLLELRRSTRHRVTTTREPRGSHYMSSLYEEGRGDACGVGDAGQGGEHAAGENPPSQETEHQQESQHCGSRWAEDAWAEVVWVEGAQEVGEVGNESPDGHITQEEHPHGGEQQGTGEHEEAGVAEGE